VIHSLAGGSDGYIPYGILAFGQSNSLFGTTEYGGGLGQCFYTTLAYCGTIFKMTRTGSSWSESTYLSFDSSGTLGFTPVTGVLVNPDGTLYATTSFGGTNDVGTVSRDSSLNQPLRTVKSVCAAACPARVLPPFRKLS